MGQRDPRIGGNRDGGGHAGNDFERDALLTQSLRLLASASEDKRVTAFEAGNDIPPPRLFDKKAVDLLLGEGVIAPLLAGVDPARFSSGVTENLRADQMVVDDHIRLTDACRPAQRDQPGIPRPGADDVYLALLCHASFPRWRPEKLCRFIQGIQQLSASLCQDSFRQILAQCGECLSGPPELPSDDDSPVEAPDQPLDGHLPAARLCETGDRELTTAAQSFQERPFGAHFDGGYRIVQAVHYFAATGVIPPDLDADRPLADRREHHLHGQKLGNPACPAHPPEPCRGDDHAVELLRLQLPDPRIQIPAQRNDLQIGPPVPELHAPPERAGPDPRPAGHLLHLLISFRDQDVPRILPGRYGGDIQRFRQLGREVFHAVDGQIDIAAKEHLLDFPDENPFAADPRQWNVMQDIPLGTDRDELHRDAGMTIPDPLRNPSGLNEREGAPSGSKPQCS